MSSSPLGRLTRRAALPVACVLALAAITVGAVPSNAAPAAVAAGIYVSPTGDDGNPGTAGAPVRTPQKAQSLVRGLNQNMTGDIDVVLADGFYRMTSPLELTPADSGTNGHNVVWTAAPGARPVLAGSDQITGWQPMSPGSPIWVAQAPKGIQTRQLYVTAPGRPAPTGRCPES